MGERLERPERLVELDPLLRVLDRLLEAAIRASDGRCGQQHDSVVHHVVPGRPAAAGGPDPIVGRDANVVEVDLVVGLAALGEQLPQLDALALGIHQEEVDAGLGASEHDEP